MENKAAAVCIASTHGGLNTKERSISIMSEPIVAQIPTKCKVEKNPYLEEVATIRGRSRRLCERRTAEVLRLSNDEAIEFLRSVGYSQVIPGTHFTPRRDVAEFFGVGSVNFAQFLSSRNLSSRRNTRESINVHLQQFFEECGLMKHGEIVNTSGSSELFDFCFAKTGMHYVTKNSYNKINLISARVAVSAIPFFADNLRTPTYDKSKARALNDQLVLFLRQKREREKAAEEARMAVLMEAEEEAAANAKKAAELKASIAEDTLYELIKRAVTEVMSGAKFSIAAPNTNT